jgi:hypothetical protein
MLEVRSLHKQYLGIPALDHVTFVKWFVVIIG